MPRIVLHEGGIVLGYRFLGCPVSFCSGFNISLLIEQPSSLLHNNGNFDPGSYIFTHIPLLNPSFHFMFHVFFNAIPHYLKNLKP